LNNSHNHSQSKSSHSAAVRSTKTVAEILQISMREANNNNHIASRGLTSTKKGQRQQQRTGQQHQGPPSRGATPPNAPITPSRKNNNQRASPRPTSPPKSPSSMCAYAGAKFSDPPSPKVLPKPPIHWVSSSDNGFEMQGHHFLEMTSVLKNMLKVQA
jgi:proline-rich nuclear receptor coactivator 2